MLAFAGSMFGQYTIGLIGDATPTGWDADTNLVQTDSVTWEMDVDLVVGQAKFRENDMWDNSWGGTDFPAGMAILNTFDNIPIPYAGRYHIELDTSVPSYNFIIESPMGIIGNAIPGNEWTEDVNMYPVEGNPNAWTIVLELQVGECKFRLNDDWADNWGGGGFPTDTAIFNSPSNIMVDQAGEYEITFDTATLIYSFEQNVRYESIGIIGDATPTGWDADTNMVQNSENPAEYNLDLDLTDGGCKFRANDDWADNWGGTDWPSGVGVFNGPDNIPAQAGRYRISFNVESLEYNFVEIVDYATVGIVGTAVNGDFTTISAMNKIDAENYELRAELSSGDLLFVGNEDLAINWGSGDFPSGTAERDGALIPIPEGDYVITFNTVSGAYNFEVVIEYDAVSLVGKSGPFGAWPEPDDMGARDTYLEKDSEDPNSWSGEGIELTSYMGADDEGVKFRADTMWTVNWGAAEFPAGSGTQDGPNIQCLEGTYNITFNDVSGEYVFVESSSTNNLVKPEEITVFPNPTSSDLTVDLSRLNATGEISVRVFSAQGTMISDVKTEANDQIQVKTSSLETGMYYLSIQGENFLVSKNFSVK